jgi:hypothetical protein
MMEVFLGGAKNVLLPGCGGGNLATMLARSGKNLTVVDHNPVSFDLAKKFFGMPKDISCIVEDFREYLAAETRGFDGSRRRRRPRICYEEQFDPAVCHSITAQGLLNRNVLVACMPKRTARRQQAIHDGVFPNHRPAFGRCGAPVGLLITASPPS